MPVMLPPGAQPRSAPPAAALFGQGAQLPPMQAPAPQLGGGVELNPGESVLPTRPTNPPGYVPQWQAPPVQQAPPAQPQYAPQPQYQAPQQPAPQQFYNPPAPVQTFAPPLYQQPQQFQQPPVAPQQPLWVPPQQQVAPPVPAAQPNYQQFTMQPDATQGAAGQPYQFNDGLQLGGRIGGAAPTAPAVPLGGSPGAAGSAGVGVPSGMPVQPPVGPSYTPAIPAVSTALRDQLAQQGLPVSQYPNDQALLDDMGQTVQQVEALRQRMRWDQANQQPQTAAPQAPVAPAQPPAAPQKAAKPEWKQEWSAYVKKDPTTGRFVPVDNFVSPQIADRANELSAWERTRAEELVEHGMTRADFESALPDLINRAKAEALQQIEQERQVVAGQQQVQQFLQSNQAAFFQIGPNGQPVMNPVTQQPVTTAIGQAAFAYGNQYAQQFEQSYGVAPNPAQVIEYVQLRLTADQAAGRLPMAQQPAPQYGQQPPVMQPPPSPQQLKEQVIANALARQQQVAAAAYAPNQAGTIATAAQNATQPQNPRMSFRDALMQSAEQHGQLPPGFAQMYR